MAGAGAIGRRGPMLTSNLALQLCRKFLQDNSATQDITQTDAVSYNHGAYDHAARSTRVSISLRNIPKSMGLVRRASAPFSNALRLVSASP